MRRIRRKKIRVAAHPAECCFTVVLFEFRSANYSIWLSVVTWCAIVSHKSTNNKTHSERSPVRPLNHSESSCDKTVTAHRKISLIFYHGPFRCLVPPPDWCVTAVFFFFILSRADWRIIAEQKKSSAFLKEVTHWSDGKATALFGSNRKRQETFNSTCTYTVNI